MIFITPEIMTTFNLDQLSKVHITKSCPKVWMNERSVIQKITYLEISFHVQIYKRSIILKSDVQKISFNDGQISGVQLTKSSDVLLSKCWMKAQSSGLHLIQSGSF